MIIFRINENVMAVDSALVREILKDNSIYRLPFVPDYVEGMINYHGEPFTVVRLEKTDDLVFLVFKLDGDDLSLRISEILSFCDWNGEYIEETETEIEIKDDRFSSGAFMYNGKPVSVLDVNKLDWNLKKDLGWKK